MSILDNLFLPPRPSNEFTFERYIKDLRDGKFFRDKMCLGICEAKGGEYLLKNFSIEPHALYVGATGSGKSVAASFSLVTWFCANSDQTIIFLVDSVKGANDYRALFKYEESNQVYLISSETGIHRTIDLIYDEAMARREKFNEVKAENIITYEKITSTKMTRIILMMEEFHTIPYAIMNFDKDYKIPQTTANKFHTIIRIGRTMGTWVMAASQRATTTDIPSAIVPNFTQKQIFRVTRGEAAYILGSTKAADIRSDQKGRCETDDGTVQFPFMHPNTQTILLDKFVRPLTSECAYLSPTLIKDYLSGKSTSELYRHKKLSDLVESIETYDAEIIIAMVHKALGHKLESLNSQIDPHGVSYVVTWPNGQREAVMIRVGDKVKIGLKHINNLNRGMVANQCDRGVIYTSSNDLAKGVYSDAEAAKIHVVDHEDLLRLARQIETHKVSDKLTVDELVDPTKITGEYQASHPHLAPPKPTVSTLRPILQDLLPQSPEIKGPAGLVLPKLKRVSVRLTFCPKESDNFTLLVYAQKTKAGEIFRVLFYSLKENVLKHRFFVDRKLTGNLDEETANSLDVLNIKEWNAQPETLRDDQFEKRIIDYFNNFNILHAPPRVLCWENDASWLSSILIKVKKMLPTPITYEKYIESEFDEAVNRDELTELVKPSLDDMFYPLQIDHKVWVTISDEGRE